MSLPNGSLRAIARAIAFLVSPRAALTSQMKLPGAKKMRSSSEYHLHLMSVSKTKPVFINYDIVGSHFCLPSTKHNLPGLLYMGSWKHHQFQRVLVSRSIFHVSWVCSLTSKNLSFFIGKIGMKNHFLTVAMRINRAL